MSNNELNREDLYNTVDLIIEQLSHLENVHLPEATGDARDTLDNLWACVHYLDDSLKPEDNLSAETQGNITKIR